MRPIVAGRDRCAEKRQTPGTASTPPCSMHRDNETALAGACGRECSTSHRSIALTSKASAHSRMCAGPRYRPSVAALGRSPHPGLPLISQPANATMRYASSALLRLANRFIRLRKAWLRTCHGSLSKPTIVRDRAQVAGAHESRRQIAFFCLARRPARVLRPITSVSGRHFITGGRCCASPLEHRRTQPEPTVGP